MRRSWAYGLGGITGLLLLGVIACATVAPHERVSLAAADADLAPVSAESSDAALSPIDRSTEALLDAIERHTGERPAVGDGREQQPLAAATKAGDGSDWVTARRVLAMDLLRLPNDGSLRRVSVARARAALRWDLSLEVRWSEVDTRLVQQAIERGDTLLGPVAQPLPAVVASKLDLVWSEEGSGFSWPISPVRITSRFGVREDPFGEGLKRHTGLDLSGAMGQRVASAADGTVVYAGWRGAYGLHVEVRHANGYVTRYAHLSEALVSSGDHIRRGSTLGLVGRTGRATGPHLHFEIWHDGEAIDPLIELPERPSDNRFASSDRFR